MATINGPPRIEVAGPLGDKIAKYDRSRPPRSQGTSQAVAVDQTFLDAMVVREEVFVVEQGVPLQNELDQDDAHCIHVVLYAPQGQQPAGTVRILPLNSTLHIDLDQHRHLDGTEYQGPVQSSVHKDEPYIKLGRLAVIKSQRGLGYADALVKAAFKFATSNPAALQSHGTGDTIDTWTGLVLIHAQHQVQHYWARLGFVVDQGLGLWNEEGIDHVAMWHRLPVE